MKPVCKFFANSECTNPRCKFAHPLQFPVYIFSSPGVEIHPDELRAAVLSNESMAVEADNAWLNNYKQFCSETPETEVDILEYPDYFCFPFDTQRVWNEIEAFKKQGPPQYANRQFQQRGGYGQGYGSNYSQNQFQRGNRYDGSRPNGGERQPRFEGNRFDSNRFEGNRFDSNRFEGNRFEGNRFDSNRFEGSRFEGNRFEGNTKFDSNRFDNTKFDSNRFDGNRFQKNNMDGNRYDGNRADTNGFDRNRQSGFNNRFDRNRNDNSGFNRMNRQEQDGGSFNRFSNEPMEGGAPFGRDFPPNESEMTNGFDRKKGTQPFESGNVQEYEYQNIPYNYK